jgi:hypothetical protein
LDQTAKLTRTLKKCTDRTRFVDRWGADPDIVLNAVRVMLACDVKVNPIVARNKTALAILEKVSDALARATIGGSDSPAHLIENNFQGSVGSLWHRV